MTAIRPAQQKAITEKYDILQKALADLLLAFRDAGLYAGYFGFQHPDGSIYAVEVQTGAIVFTPPAKAVIYKTPALLNAKSADSRFEDISK